MTINSHNLINRTERRYLTHYYPQKIKLTQQKVILISVLLLYAVIVCCSIQFSNYSVVMIKICFTNLKFKLLSQTKTMLTQCICTLYVSLKLSFVTNNNIV